MKEPRVNQGHFDDICDACAEPYGSCWSCVHGSGSDDDFDEDEEEEK